MLFIAKNICKTVKTLTRECQCFQLIEAMSTTLAIIEIRDDTNALTANNFQFSIV